MYGTHAIMSSSLMLLVVAADQKTMDMYGTPLSSLQLPTCCHVKAINWATYGQPTPKVRPDEGFQHEAETY